MDQIHKLGRNARAFNPRVPHMSALLAGKPLAPPPPEVDWASAGKMPGSLGMMANDVLGDCTCAALYHARQIWTANTGTMFTAPDCDVELLYKLACGWGGSMSDEGPGGVEQNVLAYALNKGMPTGPSGQGLHKIAAFVEVDPRVKQDVMRTIHSCGLAYIGFQVPAFLMQGPAPAVWDVAPHNNEIVGGHAIILVGYTPETIKLISWGQFYEMTWAFFSAYVDEVYAIADTAWLTAKGTDPLGITLAELESQMEALKEA